MDKSVFKIVENDLCIGCGICKPSCPEDAISIQLNKFKEFQPIINANSCTNCGICRQSCPMEPEFLSKKINASLTKKSRYGLDNLEGTWIGFQNNDNEKYTKSASGGVLSALLAYLLETKEIDAVIHASQNFGDPNTAYFQASLSTDVESIEKNRSSFYSPIEFSEVTNQLLNTDDLRRVAIVGTPCVITAFKRLCKLNKKLASKLRFSFALVCGHNVSGQFADHLSQSISNGSEKALKLKFRDKEEIKTAANFNNSVLFEDGTKRKISRYDSPFTLYWRMGAYGLNGCNFCPDFFGEDADASFKDAWGLHLIKPEGETAFAIKNPRLAEIVFRMEQEGIIYLRRLDPEKFATSQERTYYDKTDYIEARARKHPALKKQIRHKLNFFDRFILTIVFQLKKHVQEKSKKDFSNGRIYPAKPLKALEWFVEYGEKFVLLKRRFQQKRKPAPEILYTSGFGYRNIGDEAQLQTNLQLWEKYAPDYKITLLSPRPDYTRKVHGNYDIIESSRTCFWGVSGYDYLGIGERKFFYLYFWIRKQLVWLNAFWMKFFNRAPFIGPESAILLKRLKNADVLHIGGGGLFTGKTRSRLYDLSALTKVASFLGTEVILSGHNIGIWESFRQKNALKSLKKAKYIGLRDSSGSIEALKELGVYDEEKVFPLFDDALFCEGLSKHELQNEFSRLGINPEKKYIAINCYSTPAIEKQVKDAIETMVKHLSLLSADFQFIVIATHPVDEKINDYFRSKLPEAIILDHQDSTSLIVSCFQHAYACITVRHHPIIFSMSGCVPTLSVTFDTYYELKNFGALKLFGQGDMVFKYQKETFEENFITLLRKTIEKRNGISEEINTHICRFSEQKGLIIKKYLDTVN